MDTGNYMNNTNTLKNIFISIAVVIFLILTYWGYGYYVKMKQPTASDPSLSELQKRGIMVVGSDIPYGAMEFFDESGKPAGVDVDIANEIAKEIGVTLDYRKFAWDNLFPAVKSGTIDLGMSAITITPDRQKEMLFSAPYLNAGQSIVAKFYANINSVNDIVGKKIGVQTGTTGYDYVKNKGLEKSASTFVDPAEAADALGAKKIELLIVDYVAAAEIVKKDPTLKIVGEPITEEFYGIATKLGNDALINEINRILREMKRDGRLAQIREKWLK